MAIDFYKTLGVTKKADEKEIKSAYRRLARKYHPDVNPNDPKAEAKFKEVSEAYEVLKDPDKRKKYNQFGDQWENVQKAGDNFGDFQTNFRGGGGSGPGSPGFDSIFEQFFSNFGGEGAPGGVRLQQTPPRDVEKAIELTLEEIDTGTKRGLTFSVDDACKKCQGTGYVQLNRTAAHAPCPNCKGTSVQQSTRKVEVKVPAGITHGKKLRVPGRGAKGSNGRAGDLYVLIREAKHKTFHRVGEDTEVEVDVPYIVAALGGEVSVPTIRSTVSMKVPSGSQSGQIFRLGSQGITKLGGGKGSLRVRIKITVPEGLSKEEKKLLEKIRDLEKKS